MKTETNSFYLFASSTGAPVESPATVFYRVEGESLAKSLCRLFTRDYTDANGRPSFHHKATALISTDEQVLFDEALGWLDHYDEPDRGVYDPPPPREMHLRAQYAVRAKVWEEALRGLAKSCNQGDQQSNSGPTSEISDMPPEDWQNAGLIVLMLLAQAYYKMLECTISMASWCSALDLDLNESYLWTVENITNLLKNHEDLKDFPVKFEPLFPDLYPSSIRDVDWEDMVAPGVEEFLSTVQRYVHNKGISDPEKGSQAWVFVEMFRASVNTAVERAEAYNRKMRQYCQQVLRPSPEPPPGTSAGRSTQADGNVEASGAIRAGGNIKAGGNVQSGVPAASDSNDKRGQPRPKSGPKAEVITEGQIDHEQFDTKNRRLH